MIMFPYLMCLSPLKLSNMSINTLHACTILISSVFLFSLFLSLAGEYKSKTLPRIHFDTALNDTSLNEGKHSRYWVSCVF